MILLKTPFQKASRLQLPSKHLHIVIIDAIGTIPHKRDTKILSLV